MVVGLQSRLAGVSDWLTGLAAFLWRIDTRAMEFYLGVELIRRGMFWLTGLADMSQTFYNPMTEIMSADAWGLYFVVLGSAQLIGLLVNGTWHRSPLLRVIVLLLSSSAYSVLAVCFLSYGTGGSLQSGSQQALIMITCIWCMANVASKMESGRGR